MRALNEIGGELFFCETLRNPLPLYAMHLGFNHCGAKRWFHRIRFSNGETLFHSFEEFAKENIRYQLTNVCFFLQ